MTNATMSNTDLLALVAKLQADNAKLAANATKPRAITMKVSDKGGLSIYGLGRFPVTLYVSQADKLFAPDQVEAIRTFIDANRNLFAVKG